jgi:hypothetical protein
MIERQIERLRDFGELLEPMGLGLGIDPGMARRILVDQPSQTI